MKSNYPIGPIDWLVPAAVAVVLGHAATNASAQTNRPPNPPVLTSPANGSTNMALQVYLWFQSGGDPDGDTVECDLYFGTTSPPPLLESDAYYLVVTPPLQVATTYHWHVVARDEYGAETVSPEWTFSTKLTNAPPPAPSGPNPANNSTTAGVTASLYWSCDDSDGFDMLFDVYFGTESPPPFVGTVNDYDDHSGRYAYAGLPFTTRYYWRIVARDPQGASTSGPTWTFVTKANSAPNVPGSPQPPTSGLTSTSPVLTWAASDVDVQPLTFDLYLGPTNPPPLVATSLTTASFAPPELEPGATYYWKVVASDGTFYTSSPVWTFGARQPGDVVGDNQLTAEDAACVMEMYLWNPECGGPNGYVVADANCDVNVTPADARCIHREAVGLGCDICDAAIAPVSPGEEKTVAPSVSLSSWFLDGTDLVVRLAVSGIPTLNAFGLNATANPTLPLLQALRLGTTSNFDVFEYRQVSSLYSYVGAYSLGDHTVGPDAEFIELRFDASGGLPNFLFIDSFVDDLAGAPGLALQLETMVDVGATPTRLALHQNFPNPFNPQTTISYDLPAGSARVRLSIFDLSGRAVRTLVDEDQSSGSHDVTWEGRNDAGDAVASGVYFYVLDVGTKRMTRKLVLLK